MKRILLSLMAVMLSFTAFAQADGDKVTINTSEADKQAEWNLTGESNCISSMKHTNNNELEIYIKGLEDFAFETYDINKINKDLKYMHYLLNDKQYRTYVMLLNTTLNNRGLSK